MKNTVLVLGASGINSRYSFRAIHLLWDNDYNVIMVNPTSEYIVGQKTYKNLVDVKKTKLPIDTVTVYVKPELALDLVDEIIDLHPRRVILNPGTENVILEEILDSANILVQKDDTLTLLVSGDF